MRVLAFVELCHPPYHFQRCLPVAGGARWFIQRFVLRSIDLQPLINLLCRPRTPFGTQRVYTLWPKFENVMEDKIISRGRMRYWRAERLGM